MKPILPIALAAGSLAFLPALLPASSSGSTSAAPSPTYQDEEPGPLAKAMETLQGGMRQLRRLAKDPKSPELMPLLQSLEEAAHTALINPPAAPEDLKDADLARWQISYKRESLALIDEILQLQEAALNQDAAALQAGLKTLAARKKSGHGKFQ